MKMMQSRFSGFGVEKERGLYEGYTIVLVNLTESGLRSFLVLTGGGRIREGLPVMQGLGGYHGLVSHARGGLNVWDRLGNLHACRNACRYYY